MHGRDEEFLDGVVGFDLSSAAAASLKFSATYLQARQPASVDLGEGRIGIAVRVHQARTTARRGEGMGGIGREPARQRALGRRGDGGKAAVRGAGTGVRFSPRGGGGRT